MNKFFISLIALAVAVTATAKDLSPADASRKLRLSEQVITGYYVDEVDNDQIVTEAIKAMLLTLDPHSTYTDPKETAELTTPLEGKFSGIGIAFNFVNDTVYVISTVAGGPSERVGLLPGDRILSANDSTLVKRDRTTVMGFLRGDKGTKVDLKIKRGNDLIDFRITRDDIPIFSVDAAYMADPHTGYIRISRFAEDTAKEVADALKKLKAKGMVDVIIDLQDNTGGYLGAAYELAQLFLPKGSPIVSTRGRKMPDTSYDAKADGPYQDGKLIVLVNQYSASASEIFAGAIQDNDRGVIVGRRTYGKGLVQRPFPLPDGSMIRLTTARYYTPSGRSIQRPYTKGQRDDYDHDFYERFMSGEMYSADSIHFADSLRYTTLRNHRTVYGGGGIMPDHFVAADTSMYSTYYRDLVAKGTLNQYVINYVDHNRAAIRKKYKNEDRFFKEFTVSPDMIAGLVARGEADSIPADSAGLSKSRPMIESVIKGLLARDIFEDGQYFRSTNLLNPIYTEGLKLINDETAYRRHLNGIKPNGD